MNKTLAGMISRLAILIVVFGHMYRPEVVLPIPTAVVIFIVFILAGGEGLDNND